jgi:glycosyltransferase involved in cell wall biosynthesis
MINKKVSILIPVYNRETLIEETVQSAISQTYENIEIIIVDNKSTDNTWNILQNLATQDKRIKIFQNDTNIGPVRNWKRCIDEASGKYGKILWSDDLIAPVFLEKTVPFLENKDVGFVFTKVEIFYDNSVRKLITYDIGKTGIYDSNLYINEVIEIGNYPVSPGCALFRLKDLKKNLLVDIPNKLNSDFSMHAIGNDLLIFLLTANQYKKFSFLDENLSFFRVHSGSISTQSIAKLSLLYAVTKAYFLESYRESQFEQYNSYLYFILKKHRNNNIGLLTIGDFYLDNKNTNRSVIDTLKLIYKKIKLKLNYKFKKIYS